MLSSQDRIKRLRWKSRRGLKELDVLFEAFFIKQAESLLAGGWPQLEEVLAQEDDLLLDWISGRGLILTSPLISLMGFVHASVLVPSIFIAQEPQIPSRHERRSVNDGSISFLIFKMASSTIGPQSSRSIS